MNKSNNQSKYAHLKDENICCTCLHAHNLQSPDILFLFEKKLTFVSNFLQYSFHLPITMYPSVSITLKTDDEKGGKDYRNARQNPWKGESFDYLRVRVWGIIYRRIFPTSSRPDRRYRKKWSSQSFHFIFTETYVHTFKMQKLCKICCQNRAKRNAHRMHDSGSYLLKCFKSSRKWNFRLLLWKKKSVWFGKPHREISLWKIGRQKRPLHGGGDLG